MSVVQNLMKRLPDHGWTADSYAIFRGILGIYLAIHFGGLIPWSAELFSASGVLADPATSPFSFFPNVLAAVGAPWFSFALLATATLGSLAFAAGKQDRWLAVALWYVWACLLTRNPMISNPGIPYVGWLLIMHAVLPRNAEGKAELPRVVWFAAWILMAVGYTYSGIEKLPSPSWLDGTALGYVWASPLARDTVLRGWLSELPLIWVQLMTWGALALEVLSLPLALSKRTRPILWFALLSMHIGILATVDFADLTIGMLMIHVLTFDPNWLPQSGVKKTEAIPHPPAVFLY